MSDMDNTPVESPMEDALPPDFGDLQDGGIASDPAALSTVFDLSLPVAIELGRTRLSVQEVLALGRGSVVELDRLVGDPIDIYVGDRRFAEGEVVVVGEQFGVRITQIVDGGPVRDGADS